MEVLPAEALEPFGAPPEEVGGVLGLVLLGLLQQLLVFRVVPFPTATAGALLQTQVGDESDLVLAPQLLEPVKVTMSEAEREPEGGAITLAAPPLQFPSACFTSDSRGKVASEMATITGSAASATWAGVTPWPRSQP